MRNLTSRCSSVLFLAALVAACAPLPAAAQWTSLASGVDYQEFTDSGCTVYVVRMDRDEPTAILDTAIAEGQLISGKETVRGMAERYDGTFGYWGEVWGQYTYEVVAAVNGDFHDTSTGVPHGGQLIAGIQAKRFIDFGSDTGLAWQLDRDVFVGGCVHYRGSKNFVDLPSIGDSLEIDNVNTPRGSSDLILYTDHYDSHTHTDTSGTEVLVSLDRAAMVLPDPSGATGTVQAVYTGQGDSWVPFDHVVLSGTGSASTTLASLSVGDGVRIAQELSHYEHDCNTSAPEDWTKTYASLGADEHLIADGNPQSVTSASPRARTAMGFDDTFVYMVVVDEIAGSAGMDFEDLRDFCHDTLGMTEAVSVDGGGSSTMVVDGVVMNHPSDGTSREVANAMLVVSLHDAQHSNSFTTGTVVEVASGAAIRLGPGDWYDAPHTATSAMEGVVVEHEANGLRTRGIDWWLVEVAGSPGWIDEGHLTYVSGPVGDDDDAADDDDTGQPDDDDTAPADDDTSSDDDDAPTPPGGGDDGGGCECSSGRAAAARVSPGLVGAAFLFGLGHRRRRFKGTTTPAGGSSSVRNDRLALRSWKGRSNL